MSELKECREAFELWCKTDRWLPEYITFYQGKYTNATVNHCWAAWQAALQARVAVSDAKPCDVELAEIIQNETGCADSDSLSTAWAVQEAYARSQHDTEGACG